MTDSERTLTQLWSELLDVKEIDIDTDFFELGGTSLTAFALLVKIEQVFSRSPGFGNEAFTIRRQAAFLDDSTHPPGNGVRPIFLKGKSNDDQRNPIFLVHGAASDELDCYFHLVRSLPDELNIYGLQSQGSLAGTEFATIEEMAEQHVRSIQSVQPVGPYNLGGYAFGGLVAFEIAQQFLAMGEAVENLIILDYQMSSTKPFRWPRTPSQLAVFLGNFSLALRDLMNSKRAFKERFEEVTAWIKRVMVTHSGDGVQGAPETGFWHCGGLTAQQARRSLAQFRASVNYVPRPYSGPLTLFRHRRLPILHPYDDSLGWNSLCPTGIDIRIVEGSTMNGSMLRAENAPAIARDLLSSFSFLGCRTSHYSAGALVG